MNALGGGDAAYRKAWELEQTKCPIFETRHQKSQAKPLHGAPRSPSLNRAQSLTWPLCRNVSEIFAAQSLEDFAGNLPGGFFWALSPRNKMKNNLVTKKRPQKKTVLPKTSLTIPFDKQRAQRSILSIETLHKKNKNIENFIYSQPRLFRTPLVWHRKSINNDKFLTVFNNETLGQIPVEPIGFVSWLDETGLVRLWDKEHSSLRKANLSHGQGVGDRTAPEDTILVTIIAFWLRMQLTVTASAENDWESLRGIISWNCILFRTTGKL